MAGSAMLSRVWHWACGASLLLAVLTAGAPAHAWCIWGFGQCAPSNLGEYVLDDNPGAGLTITRDKITSRIGPVSFTADYVVKSVEGKNVAIEVGVPDPKVMLHIQVEKDVIRIGTKHLFAGDWRKK